MQQPQERSVTKSGSTIRLFDYYGWYDGGCRSSSSSSGGASLAGRSCLHEFTPLGTVLRTLPRRVEAEIVLLEVELNRSKSDALIN